MLHFNKRKAFYKEEAKKRFSFITLPTSYFRQFKLLIGKILGFQNLINKILRKHETLGGNNSFDLNYFIIRRAL